MIALSALLSGSEVALFSISSTQKESLTNENSSVSNRILKLLEKPKTLLATILIANNLIKEIVNKEGSKGAFTGFESKLTTNNIPNILGVSKENGLDFVYKIMTANKKYFLTSTHSVASTFNQISQYM